MKENSLLNEKYRPITLDKFVGNENIKKSLSKYLEQNDILNLIFYGPAGTGKTTLAKLIVQNLDCDYLYINASDERGIETIRDKVQGFASTISFEPIKVVILDEADFLTIQAQASLRNIIETFSRTTRFIMTCNYVERIIDPLQSRCQVLKIIPPTKKDVAKHLAWILNQESIKYDIKDLVPLINQYYPDLRKCINTIQLSTLDNQLKLDQSVLVSSNYIDKVINALSEGSKFNKIDCYNDIRQIIADANVDDFDELFKALYTRASDYLEHKEGTASILINEHQYKANFRIDKEINAMSLIQNLINNK
ncbi:AAA family ATPase [bacterium]|nr:AAA family ATPase [bacterium]|tara:strand:- start:801 stop:1724 length:924 start_codon:yes stop_codon:yes gene_type:complete